MTRPALLGDLRLTIDPQGSPSSSMDGWRFPSTILLAPLFNLVACRSLTRKVPAWGWPPGHSPIRSETLRFEAALRSNDATSTRWHRSS